MSRGLKILARELDVPVIALSQLNRSVEAGHDKSRCSQTCASPAALEQDADLVMFIYRDEYYNQGGVRAPGRGGAPHRQAPQRRPGRRQAHLPGPVPAVHDLRRPRPLRRERAAAPTTSATAAGSSSTRSTKTARRLPLPPRAASAAPGRARLSAVIPRRYRACRSIARRSSTWTPRWSARSAATPTTSPSSLDAGPGPVVHGRRRAPARPRWPCSSPRRRWTPGARSPSTRCRACSRRSARTYDEGSRAHLRRAARPPGRRSTCCTSTTSAPSTRSEWVLEELYSIINARYEEQRSLIVTTNLDHEQLREQIGRAHGLAPGRDLPRPLPLYGHDRRMDLRRSAPAAMPNSAGRLCPRS